MDTLSLSKKLLDVIGHTIEKEGGSLVHDEAYWDSVLDRCVEQGIQGLTAEAARLQSDIPEQVLMDWDATLWKMEMDHDEHAARLEELISGLEAAGRRVTLLKGHSVSCFWPNAALRPQGDIDLWLDDSDAGDVYFKSSGIEVKAAGKHTHFLYKGITVENHHLLLGTSESDNKIAARIDACHPGEGHSLTPTASYLFLMAHLGRHFLSYESINLRQLLDLVFMVEACRDRIDCQYLSSALRESGLDRFNDLVIAVLEQCLDIDFPDLFATGNRFTAREKERVFRDILSSKKQLPTGRVKALAERCRRFLAQNWKYAYHPDSLAMHLINPSIITGEKLPKIV